MEKPHPSRRARDDVAAVARSIARRFAQLLDASVIVLAPDPEGMWLLRLAMEGRPEDGLGTLGLDPVSTKDRFVARARDDGAAVVTPNAASAIDWTTVGSAVTFGLSMDDEWLGVILAARRIGAPDLGALDVALGRTILPAATRELRAARTDSLRRAVVVPSRVLRLQALTAALNEATTLSRIARSLVELGAPAATALTSACLLVDMEGEAMTVAASHGLPVAFAPVGRPIELAGEHPIARAVRLGESEYYATTTAIAHAYAHLSPGVLEGIEALAIVPLEVDDVPLGAFVATFHTSVLLDAEVRTVLRGIARQTGRALYRVHTREQDRRARQRLEHLSRATARYAMTTDLEVTLQNVLDSFVPDITDGAAIVLTGLERTVARHEHGEVADALASGAIAPTLTLPLEVAGQDLGELRLLCSPPELPRETQLFIEELARRAALAIDAARVMREREAAVRAREDFLAVAGHELRTPLTTLRMLMFSLDKLGPAAPFDPVAAARQITRLEQLVNTFNDVPRLGRDEVVLELEDLDLTALVRETVATMPYVHVTASGPIIGRWDSFRLGQILTNLLVNALKYGRGEAVDVIVEGGEERARVTVIDRGIGIPAAELERIFDRFERAVSSRNYAGLGLGLWIARRLARAHGGDVSVVSEVDKGSTFVLDLPRRTA